MTARRTIGRKTMMTMMKTTATVRSKNNKNSVKHNNSNNYKKHNSKKNDKGKFADTCTSMSASWFHC